MATTRAIVAWMVRGPEGSVLHQRAHGTLTTERGARGYGPPVFVADGRHEIKRQFGALESGVAYGPADLPAGYELIVDARTPADAALARAARAAGYANVSVQDLTDIG